MIGHSKVSSIAFTHTNTHTHSVCELCSQELIGVRLVGAKGVIKKEKQTDLCIIPTQKFILIPSMPHIT